jgi:hypothetical protein
MAKWEYGVMGNFMAKWEYGKMGNGEMGIWRNGPKTPHHDHKILNWAYRTTAMGGKSP